MSASSREAEPPSRDGSTTSCPNPAALAAMLAWEVPRLVAHLDPSIPACLQSTHPATGWCHACRLAAPCPIRHLADLAADYLRRGECDQVTAVR